MKNQMQILWFIVIILLIISFMVFLVSQDYFKGNQPKLIKNELKSNQKSLLNDKKKILKSKKKEFKGIKPEEGKSLLKKGKKIFQQNCFSCHAILKKEKRGVYPSLEELSSKNWKEFLKIVKYGIEGTAMIGRPLKKEDIRAMYLWLQHIRKYYFQSQQR